MAKSKNHTTHHNSRKDHRHGISRPARHRHSTRRHMDPKYRRNLRYVQRGNARVNRRVRTLAVIECEVVEVKALKATAEKAQIRKLHDLFDECDLDGSGDLCLEELRIVLKQKGYSDHFVERFYCHLDLNKDGFVTREEFDQALKFLPKEIFTSNRALSNEELLAIFDEVDTDKSGAVSWTEFKTALAARGFGTEFISTYFRQMDLNLDREIHRQEYARCLGIQLQPTKSVAPRASQTSSKN